MVFRGRGVICIYSAYIMRLFFGFDKLFSHIVKKMLHLLGEPATVLFSGLR